MTEIEKLETCALWCLCMTYFLGGLAAGIVLMTGHPLGVEDPEWLVVFTIGAIGLSFLWLRREIWKKIETESTEGDGE